MTARPGSLRFPAWVELSPEGNVISLKEAVVRLDEVFLSNKIPHADTIIARVREHIAVNYRPRLKRHHIFARETEYVDFEEMDFEVSRASGFSGEELHQTNLELNALSKAIINNRTLHFRDFLGDRKNQPSWRLKRLPHC